MEGGYPDGRALGLFAWLLDYPREGLATHAEEAGRELACSSPEAATLLAEFRSSLAETPQARMEEIYTATFDLQAACCPYIGVHLFGEGHKRRVFMARLNEIYESRGFRAAGELPDHLTAVLGFLSEAAGEDDAMPLREDGLIPALDKMIGAFREGSINPYVKVLCALRIVLRSAQPCAAGAPVPGGEV